MFGVMSGISYHEVSSVSQWIGDVTVSVLSVNDSLEA